MRSYMMFEALLACSFIVHSKAKAEKKAAMKVQAEQHAAVQLATEQRIAAEKLDVAADAEKCREAAVAAGRMRAEVLAMVDAAVDIAAKKRAIGTAHVEPLEASCNESTQEANC